MKCRARMVQFLFSTSEAMPEISGSYPDSRAWHESCKLAVEDLLPRNPRNIFYK